MTKSTKKAASTTPTDHMVTDILNLDIEGRIISLQRQATLGTATKRRRSGAWYSADISKIESRLLNGQIPALLDKGEQFKTTLGLATVIDIDD
ncbi:hypothetical protein AB4480_08305 [Vibrio sp. 10N.261.45.A4]|uniref:hypothetical protein n=1 Tax=Vibrio sp. 10N.261.45.A4 TaxID=3229655 RepID=UPI00354CC36B